MSRLPHSPFAESARELMPWIVEHRRHLHLHPELSYGEEQTSEYLATAVRGLGMTPVRVREGRYGFYADLIAPKNPNRFVALRADMDALPIQEETGLSFTSTNPGVGHLCGHDSHSAMLLGAAKLLTARQVDLPFSVRFFFQHAEEVPPGGAVDFIAAGALEKVEYCFGLHVRPRVPVGALSVRPGPQMAGTATVIVCVRGTGGHAAMPHEANDPVLAAAAIIVAVQSVVSRRIDPFDTAVVSFCTMKGGSAHNVIPEEVELTGTIRAYTMAKLKILGDHVREVARHIALAHRCEAFVDIDEGYPPVVNDPEATAMMQRAATAVLGEGHISSDAMSMGGEDFAYYCQERPSAFGFLGVSNDGDPYYALHHPKFHPVEDAFWRGTAILAQLPFTVGETKS